MRAAPRLVLGSNLVDSITAISDQVIRLHSEYGITLVGGVISAVADQVPGSTNAALQTLAGSRPALATGINGLQGIRGAASKYLTLPNIFTALTEAEVWLVTELDADPPALVADTGIWVLGSDTGQSAHFPLTTGDIYDQFGTNSRKNAGNPAASLANPCLYNVTSKAGSWTARLNGTQIFNTLTNTVGFTSAPIIGASGGGPAQFMAGVWHQFIVFSRENTAGERTTIRSELSSYYGASF